MNVFGVFLANNDALRELDISWNHFSATGMKHICKGLMVRSNEEVVLLLYSTHTERQYIVVL